MRRIRADGRLAAEEAVEQGQDTQICIEILPKNHRDKTQEETRLVRALGVRAALCWATCESEVEKE